MSGIDARLAELGISIPQLVVAERESAASLLLK